MKNQQLLFETNQKKFYNVTTITNSKLMFFWLVFNKSWKRKFQNIKLEETASSIHHHSCWISKGQSKIVSWRKKDNIHRNNFRMKSKEDVSLLYEKLPALKIPTKKVLNIFFFFLLSYNFASWKKLLKS